MAQTTAEQRAEVARLLADVTKGSAGYWDEQRLLELVPALLADAEALADFAVLAREIRATAGDGDTIAVFGETMRWWAAELERATGG